MFWHHDSTSQPSSSSATTMTPSQGTSEVALTSEDDLCDPWRDRISAIQTSPASVSSISSHCTRAISRHHPVTLSRDGRPRATAAPRAAWASLARDRAAARTVRDQGSGREPPTSSANTVTALSMSDRCAWTTSAESSASSLRAEVGPAPRSRAASRPGGQPM